MNDIIDKIRKHYRKENNIFEIILSKYDGLNYYIRLDVDKKFQYCFLRSYNFDLINKFDKNLINQEVLNAGFVSHIYDIFYDESIPTEYNTLTSEDGTVKIKFNINKVSYNYSFNYFIPKELSFLQNIIYTVVTDLPGRLNELYYELSAEIDNNTEKYLYNKPFKFDLIKGDLTKIFKHEVINKGENYYKENRVRFVEKINGAYYAIVNGNNNQLYSVIINYDPKKKITTLGCNCPCVFKCKHMYAVIEHIRKKEFYRFYKVIYLENETDQMYDKLFANNNTYLCIGIDGKYIILMMPNGELHAFNAYDNDGRLLYKVIEDDEEHSLEKEIEKIKELD